MNFDLSQLTKYINVEIEYWIKMVAIQIMLLVNNLKNKYLLRLDLCPQIWIQINY